MGALTLIGLLVVTVACALLGNRIAREKRRRRHLWTLAVALFPPLLVVLYCLPEAPGRGS